MPGGCANHGINRASQAICLLLYVIVLYRASLARENEAGGSWSIYSMLTYDFVLFLVVIIELFPNSVFQLYCPKDYYKQKQ